jgi:predicted HAD superfamily Cof-like phosphohydrolase
MKEEKLMEAKSLNKVREFHRVFGAPVLSKPLIPKDRAQLRIDLIEEELNELKEAIKDNDIVEVADAFADIQYVLSGAILEFGMGNLFEELFNEVHRSNMSKACDNLYEARETKKQYELLKATPCYINFGPNGGYLVKRVSDEKILKSINYSPANLAGILED